MKLFFKILISVIFILLSLWGIGYFINQSLSSVGVLNKTKLADSPNFDGQYFINSDWFDTAYGGTTWEINKALLFDNKSPSSPEIPIKVMPITSEQLANLPENETVFFRLGHSSLLIWLDGEFWLTDPMFSERASPFSFIGPKRFHQPPISLADLPNIQGVILSHNHYDHMDKATLITLKDKAEHFYMPLGLGGDLLEWGIERDKITELDWWQDVQVGSVKLTATPSHHFSGRSLSDYDQSLWASWVITGLNSNLFFSGDSGYFEGFKEIGDKLGPFDVSFMEMGAYGKLWPSAHMQPRASVKAHLDLNSDLMIPIHNGTFNLALHNWYDPFKKLEKISKKIEFNWYTPSIGEAVQVGKTYPINRWWQDSIIAEVQ